MAERATTVDLLEAQLLDEERERKHIKEQEEARREHELRLARLKYATQPRHKAVARVLIASAKSPALAILAIMLPLLILRGKDIPKPLADFIEL